MKALAASSLALAMIVAAGSANANDYYDTQGYDSQGYDSQAYDGQGYDNQGYDNAYADDASYPRYTTGQDPAYDMARVLSVEPIVERGAPRQRQECWNEPVTYAQQYPQRTSGGGAVLGAIIGGLIGNAVVDDDRHYHRGRYGRGYYHEDNDEAVATVAGAVIGGAIGNGIERSNQRNVAYRTQQVQRCRLVADGPGDEYVSGYVVNYEYGGRQYQTTTDYHPGNELRVRVQVTPEG